MSFKPSVPGLGTFTSSRTFCQRDTSISYNKEITPRDLARQYNTPKRLLRTEISTLVRLVAKVEAAFTKPNPDSMQTMINRTEVLLDEMHEILAAPLRAPKEPSSTPDSLSPLSDGDMLREPIFYSGESAYEFQYRDFAVQKYRRDTAWLEKKFWLLHQRCIPQRSRILGAARSELPSHRWHRREFIRIPPVIVVIPVAVRARAAVVPYSQDSCGKPGSTAAQSVR